MRTLRHRCLQRVGRRELAAVAALLCLAGFLRLFGVDWDARHHLHPDERFLTMVANDVRFPHSVAAYFDTATSPLNPANVGRGYFTYGTFPLFLVRAAAAALGLDDYDHIPLVGRTLAALFDLATLLLAWLIARRLGGRRAALAALALLAFSVISIQQAHFFTVDSFAACFATAALAVLIEIALGSGLRAHAGFGIAVGLMLACRINLLVLTAAYPVVLAMMRWRDRARYRDLAAAAALAFLAAALTFRVFQPYAFAGPLLSIPTLAPAFVQSMHTILAFSTGAADFPPSVQWIGRVPVLFPGWNLFRWGLGPAWGIAALAAVIWAVGNRSSAERGREAAAIRLVLLWAVLLFFFQAAQFVATLRYFLPVVPPLAVLTGCCFTSAKRRAHLLAIAAVILFTCAWAVAFTSIYARPHTRVYASEWIYDQVPPGATIATEHWDDALPLGLVGRTPDRFEHVELKLYDEETEAKRESLIAALDRSDVIVLSSNRLYRSIPRAPWRYPIARRYYELLFAGELGFRLDHVFASYPRIGSIEIADDAAEEAFTVYDHPKVLVFRKTPAYSHGRVADLLNAVSLAQVRRVPPGETSALFRQMRPTEIPLPGERAARAPLPPGATGSIASLVRWVLALEILSLTIFALGFRVWAILPDRGYGLAKVLAWLAPASVVWLLASYGIVDVGVRSARGAGLAIAALGAAAGWIQRAGVRAWARGSDPNRSAAYPKPALRQLIVVETVFLGGFLAFALLRAWNPAVAWGEKPMDFAILNAILRSPTVPPADPWYAGAPLNYFYFGQFVTAVMSQLTGVAPQFAFNLAIATIAGLLGTAGLVATRQLAGHTRVAIFAAAALLLLGNFAGPRLLLASAPPKGFDYFWATSRVIPGTINEFPAWSLAFADLHAHVLAMPLELTLLALGLMWQPRHPGSGTATRLALAVVSAWLLGALAITSSWSALTAVAVQFVLLLTAWRCARAGVPGLVQAAGVFVGMIAGAILLFLPFWSHYASPASHWGAVRPEAAGLVDVATIFGPLLVLGVPTLVARWLRNGRVATRLMSAILILAIVGGAAALRSSACGLFAGISLLGFSVWLLDHDPVVESAAACFAIAGAVGAATECVFLWDRMNTVFKFYLQMWLLLTPAAVALAAISVRVTSGRRRAAAIAVSGIAVAAGVFTMTTGVAGLLRDPRVPGPHPTLDGLAYLRDRSPAELDAYNWINQNVPGIPVVLEAHGPSYQEFSRVSMNTGLPTVLGWEYHVFQQSRPQDQIDARSEDVRELFETTDLDRATQLLDHYRVDLVVIGPLERRTYKAAGLAKFAGWNAVQPVFTNARVSIYARRTLGASMRTSIRAIAPSIPLGRLREPRGIARAADGTFAVADFGNRRVVLAGADGKLTAQFGVEGDGPAEFRDPCAIAFEDDGTVLVADTWNHRIQRIARTGQMLAEWRAELYGPRGITRARDGLVYVTDTGHHRVVRFTSDGAAADVVAPGVLDNPVGIALNAAGEIFVADVGHSRIAVFAPDGRLARSWPIDGWSVKAYLEPQLAIGPDGVLWVTDPPRGRVLLFDQSGRPLGEAEPDAPLGIPTGIAVIDGGSAMVSDARENRLTRVTRRF